MSSQWHYVKNGNRFGPVTSEELRDMAGRGKLAPTDLIWKQGLSDWRPASTVHRLFPAHQRAVVVTPPPIPANVTHVYQYLDSSIKTPGALIAKGGITTPLLISAISNIIFALIWFAFCLTAPIGIGLVVLCIFEFMLYSEADSLPLEEFARKAHAIGVCEIIGGLFNTVSLVCGIIVLIYTGKIRKPTGLNL